MSFQRSRRPARVAFLTLALSLLAALPVIPASAATVERIVSPGGIEAWMVRDESLPILSVEFSFRGGAASDPAGKEGLSDLTAALLDEGAGPYDSPDFQGMLQDMSITLSFGAGDDTFRGSLRTLHTYRDQAVELARLALTQPRFDTEPVERIRAQLRLRLERQGSDPDAILGDVFGRTVYGTHPYGRTSRQALTALDGLTTDDMRALVGARFARDGLIIGVVTDLEPEAVGLILDRMFGELPATGNLPELPRAQVASAGGTVVVQAPVPQSVAAFGQQGITRDDPDYYAAQVMNFILGGGGFVSRLTTEVRETRGLAYSVYSYMVSRDLGGLIQGGVATQNARIAESLEVIRAEWGRMAENGPTEAELEAAKAYLTGSFALGFTSSGAVARTLVGMQYNDLGQDYLDRYADYIEAVTLEDTRRVAARLLNPETLVTVVVGEPEGVTSTLPAPDLGG